MSIQPAGDTGVNAALKAGSVEVSPLGVVVVTLGVCFCYSMTLAVFSFRGGSLKVSSDELDVKVNPPDQTPDSGPPTGS
jgi:hypothetical protein